MCCFAVSVSYWCQWRGYSSMELEMQSLENWCLVTVESTHPSSYYFGQCPWWLVGLLCTTVSMSQITHYSSCLWHPWISSFQIMTWHLVTSFSSRRRFACEPRWKVQQWAFSQSLRSVICTPLRILQFEWVGIQYMECSHGRDTFWSASLSLTSSLYSWSSLWSSNGSWWYCQCVQWASLKTLPICLSGYDCWGRGSILLPVSKHSS